MGNPTVRWFEELGSSGWGGRTGAYGDPALGEDHFGHDFWRRWRWVTFPTSLTEDPCVSHCVRDQREASWGSGSPNTGTGEGLFPTSLTIALGKSLQGATALVVAQSELRWHTRDTFHKKVKRTNKKNKKKKKTKPEGSELVLLPVASWSNWEMSFLSLLSLPVSAGTLHHQRHWFGLSAQSAAWCAWRRQRTVFSMFGAAHGPREPSYFFLNEQSWITSAFLDVFFKHLNSLLLHLLMCFQMLFARLAVPANELQLLWGRTALEILWSCRKQVFLFEYAFFFFFFAFFPWIQSTSFCRAADSQLSSGTWNIPPVTLLLLEFSHCLTGERCLLSRRNRNSYMELPISYNPIPLRLKKAASAGCVNGVSISCSPHAFLPSASLPNDGETLLIGFSFSSLHAERRGGRWARGWCEHHAACPERKAQGEWDGKCKLYP